MKKFLFTVIAILSVFMYGCKANEPFVFSQENVNSVFSANKLPFILEDAYDVDNSREVDQYIGSLASDDAEKVFSGSFGYTESTDGRKRVVVTPLGLEAEHTEALINSFCEIMGIKDGGKIYDKISEKYAAEEYVAFYDIAVDIEFDYESYHIKAQLDKDSQPPVIVSLVFENDTYNRWTKQENERIRQEMFEKYPLYYSREPFDVEPQPRPEELNSEFLAENIPLKVKDIDSEISDLGIVGHTYELYNDDDWVAHISIRQVVSGKYASFMYMTLSDYYKQPDAAGYPVKAAAAAFGYADDVNGLELKVKDFLTRDYRSFSPERFIKHGDIYCEVITSDDYITGEKYLISVTLYEPDMLKAELTLTMDTDENDKLVYDKFFG